MQLIDTHCHIHDSEFAKKYEQTADELLTAAQKVDVMSVICVGTDLKSSVEAVTFAANRDTVEASVALHPHEAANMSEEAIDTAVHELEVLIQSASKPVIAIGECGLDYFYHSDEETRTRQKYLLRKQLELGQRYSLPFIFHVREAFDDFFKILDEFKNVRGVVHSFTAGTEELEASIKRGLYIGLNGIITFSKQTSQLKAARQAPIEKLVLETDAPFLTPKPFRGKMCKPEHLRVTAQFLAELREETLEDLATATTANAKQLFGL
jgi:TatD DNase family protein